MTLIITIVIVMIIISIVQNPKCSMDFTLVPILELMIGFIGHDSALVRLYWTGEY